MPDGTDLKACAFMVCVSAVVVVQGSAAVQAPLQVAGQEWLITCVSMGNPHAVVFGTKQGKLKVAFLLHLYAFHRGNAVFCFCVIPACYMFQPCNSI